MMTSLLISISLGPPDLDSVSSLSPFLCAVDGLGIKDAVEVPDFMAFNSTAILSGEIEATLPAPL